MCRIPCCLCRKCCCIPRQASSASSGEIYVTYRYRYEDVPMQTYYGPGYSARDALENMADSLADIARKLP